MDMKAIKMPWRCSVLAVLAVAWAAVIGPAPALAEPVAMVTDMAGGNSVTGMGESTALSLLDELEPGGNVDLVAGSRLVIVYYESGNEFIFEGPASIKIGPAEPEILSGKKPQARQILLAGIIQPAGMIQASIVMRGVADNIDIKLENLVDTKTLEARPLFRWQPLPGATSYRFELIDDSGDSLAGADITATEMPLPEAVTLEVGVTYTWEVAARTPDGILHSSWGDFTLATDAERALIEQMRPARDASFSSRVMFAVVLQQLELRDEAVAHWKTLLAERSDDSKLRQMAGQ
jgi:hypothetical protein